MHPALVIAGRLRDLADELEQSVAPARTTAAEPQPTPAAAPVAPLVAVPQPLPGDLPYPRTPPLRHRFDASTLHALHGAGPASESEMIATLINAVAELQSRA